MRFYRYVPGPPLVECVDHFWLVDAPTTEHPRQTLFPDGGVTILFNLADPQHLIDRRSGEVSVYRDAWIAGERTEPYLIETPGATRIAGIRFRPGGARPFIPVPAIELTGLVLPLDEIFGTAGERCRQHLAATTTPEAVFQHLTVFLTRIRRQGLPLRHHTLHGAIDEIGALGPSASIVQLAKRLGTSHRNLLRQFDDWVGLKPKTLQRIIRFQRVISLEDALHGIGWSTIAYRCGYYDQAHLVRDFKMLSGLTPTRYRQLRLEYPNYAPDS